MIDCPSTATLARLGTDSLRDETIAALEGHIRGCPDCQDELNRLVQNDSGESTMPTLPGPARPPRVPGFWIERGVGRGGAGGASPGRRPRPAPRGRRRS